MRTLLRSAALLLHCIVVFFRSHREQAMFELDYYNAERIHTSIGDAPVGRPMESRPSHRAKVVGFPRVGGLHHRYAWREAS
jgi:hypothetical protein